MRPACCLLHPLWSNISSLPISESRAANCYWAGTRVQMLTNPDIKPSDLELLLRIFKQVLEEARSDHCRALPSELVERLGKVLMERLCSGERNFEKLKQAALASLPTECGSV